MTHISESELNDYVDGVLDVRARFSVEAHLAQCEPCRSEAEALRSLLGDIGALPRQIAPSRDLRGGIAERIATAQRIEPLRSPRRLRWLVPVAAAAMLVIATATLTRWVVLRERPSVPTPASSRSAVFPVSFLNQEARYHQAITNLQHTLDRERGELAPQTVAILERNLAIIDRAIAESRIALASDPANQDLSRMIFSAYEQKLQLLQRARVSAL